MLYKKLARGTNPSNAIGSCSLAVCVGVSCRVQVGGASVGLLVVAGEEVAVGVGWRAVVWNVVTGTM